jgi:hypothetical protein
MTTIESILLIAWSTSISARLSSGALHLGRIFGGKTKHVSRVGGIFMVYGSYFMEDAENWLRQYATSR